MDQPLQKMSMNYNPHFRLLHDYFPAVENWLKLRSYICNLSNNVGPERGMY